MPPQAGQPDFYRYPAVAGYRSRQDPAAVWRQGPPHDQPGKIIIQEIVNEIKKLRGQIDIIYLENYDMRVASLLIPGVDLWLNNPMRPLEASGTSGMKAALNRCPTSAYWMGGG
ncbi:MAG: glycogen/starch/alpha-glucan phosphorylase [Syntrophotaleaceae bacterium]